MVSLSVRMACCGQTEVHGLQGTSWKQWKTGKTPVSLAAVRGARRCPGRDFSTVAFSSHSCGTSPAYTPRCRAIFSPSILPVNMAAEASAISWASPAWKTSMPNCFGLQVNSFTSARPTAIRTVSTAKVFSVPGTTFQPVVERGDGGRLDPLAARGADDGVAR